MTVYGFMLLHLLVFCAVASLTVAGAGPGLLVAWVGDKRHNERVSAIGDITAVVGWIAGNAGLAVMAAYNVI